MIKVSVCVTTYNVAPYVEECLNSILQQNTDFDFEILVGDDCSTDGTREKLRFYEKKYPKKINVVYHPVNMGVNFNDYTLITKAQGRYIAWCDGDDFWVDKYKLAKQVSFLDENQTCSAVFTNWTDYYEDSAVLVDVKVRYLDWEKQMCGKEYVRRILTNRSSGHRFSSIVFRSNYVKKFLANDATIYLNIKHKLNDVALFCILSYYGSFGLIEDHSTIYRIRANSLSHYVSVDKKLDYLLGSFYLKSYLMKYFNIYDSAIIYNSMTFIAPALYVNNLKLLAAEIENVCKEVGYKFTKGQKIMLLSTRNCLIRAVTYLPLATLLKKDNYRLSTQWLVKSYCS